MQKFIRSSFTVVGMIVGLTFIVACAPTTPPPQTLAPATNAPAATAVPPTATSAVPKRTDATIVIGTRPEDLDPHNVNGTTDYTLHHNIFDTLVDRDATGKLIPGLALEWKTVGPTIWEFKLRPGVKFSNGEPWDAKAAKASIDRLASTGSWGTKRQFGLWRSIDRGEVVDDSTVRVITKTPSGVIVNNLTVGFMMPESIAKKYANAPITNPADIVGTGAFRMTRWEPGLTTVLEANPSYWGEAKPKLQRVTVKYLVEPATRSSALQAGDADISYPLEPLETVNQLRADPKLELHTLDSFRVTWIGFGFKRKPFSDPKLREAAVRAVNFDTIGKTVLLGEGKLCQCLIAPGIFGAANDLDPKLYNFNPDRSKELLKEAGFAPGAGPEVLFVSTLGVPVKILEALVGQLNTAGFKTRLERLEFADFSRVRLAGEFDISANPFQSSTGDADFVLPPMFYTGQSRTLYSNPEVDKLLDQGAAEVDQNKRLDLYHKASEVIWADRANFWAYQITLYVGTNKKLGGFVPRADELLRFQTLVWLD